MKFKAQKMEESTYMSFDTLDVDSIILPSIPSRTASDLFEWTKNDEILLDGEDRPLELAVNANSPVTFNLVAGSDRTAEVLRNLQSGSFTPLQRKKLMERFNIDDETMSAVSSDFGDQPASSASGSTGKCDSLEGSPITTERNRASKVAFANSNGKAGPTPKETPNKMKDLDHLRNGKSTAQKPDKVTQVLGGNSTQRSSNGRVHGKSSKKPAPLSHRNGREQTMSASARRLFSSLRKSKLGRSASKEREKQSPAKQSASTPQEELSSDVHLPGILKIFGDAVSPGANYKSVLATRQSNARELVKTALERYGVSRSAAKKYVLCEVVGRIREEQKPKPKETTKEGRVEYSVVVSPQSKESSPEHKKDILNEKFTEDYIRPLNDHEKPLVLQSFWKPLEGYARRFELRKKSEVLDLMKNDKDTETRGINAQAKRLIMQKTRLSRTQSSLSLKIPTADSSSSEDENDETEKNNNKETNHQHTNIPTPAEFADNEISPTIMNGDRFPAPFLITLQGEDGVSSGPGNDKGGSLVHYLENKVIVIGKSQDPPLDGSSLGSMKEVNIRLDDEEIKSRHCFIYKLPRDEDKEASPSDSHWSMTLHPVSNECHVAVNGVRVSSDKEIINGDIIAIGTKFIFMLKDPSSKSNLTSNVRLTGGSLNTPINRLNSIASRGSAFTPVKKRCVDCEITYRLEFEDNVLDVIFAAANDIVSSSSSKNLSENCDREQAPSRLLCHCIEQACFNLNLEQKRSLLFVIATNLQTILLDATGSISLQDDAKIKNPEEGINYILPKLEAVVFWMSNSLEIFSFLQTDLVERIKARVDKELELNEVDANLLNEASTFTVSDDILAVLEEVVMYAFQQLVYYLTKTLYGALPNVLDSNPFAEVHEAEDPVHGTGHVIAIYDAALGLTRKYGVHPAIESQLFAYLFFFTNVSLFNTLMEEDAGPKYYRWDKGVQIRGNLEEIECWANDNGFQEQATEFLAKISSLTNLLATPKGQMLQNSWSHFRHDFPQLHPVQLRQILDGYVLGSRVQKRPNDWIPDANDLEDSTEEEYILDSYDNHPPLMLPTDGSQLNLDEAPKSSWYSALKDVVLAVGQGAELTHLKPQDAWLKNSNNNNDTVGKREQPDGREITSADSSLQHQPPSSISSSSTSSFTDKSHPSQNHYGSESLSHSDIAEAIKLTARPMSQSTTSLSSMISDATSQASHQAEHMFLADNLHFTNADNILAHQQNGHVKSPTAAPRRKSSKAPSVRPHKQTELGHRSDTASDAESINTSVTSNDSGCQSPNKKRSSKRSKSQKDPADFTIRDFRTDPEISINSLLMKQHEKKKKHRHNGVFIEDNSLSTGTDSGVRASSTDSIINVDDVTSPKRGDSIADLRVLPVSNVQTRHSEIANHKPRQVSSSSESTNDGPQTLPNEVFIVDVIKGKKGLGLGMVDGMYTSLQVPGVFVRSLVPDGPSVKRVRTKHQEVIKCWLKEGRLQLGDRILAVNGTSLISMNYASAMNEVRQAGDHMRFLVGRSGSEVAVKITSSSC